MWKNTRMSEIPRLWKDFAKTLFQNRFFETMISYGHSELNGLYKLPCWSFRSLVGPSHCFFLEITFFTQPHFSALWKDTLLPKFPDFQKKFHHFTFQNRLFAFGTMKSIRFITFWIKWSRSQNNFFLLPNPTLAPCGKICYVWNS